MQESYNENPDFKFGVLVDYGKPISDTELCLAETKWISQTKAYEEGWNQTVGGIGGSGMKYTEKQLQAKSERVSDDKNPMSKITLNDFLQIIEMLKSGANNMEIGKTFNINDRYVSLIRNKKRHKKWFEKYALDYVVVSGRQFQGHSKLTDKQILEIKQIIQTTNETNVSIAKQYSVDPSTISRLRSKINREE